MVALTGAAGRYAIGVLVVHAELQATRQKRNNPGKTKKQNINKHQMEMKMTTNTCNNKIHE